jgi:hypothetical protein
MKFRLAKDVADAHKAKPLILRQRPLALLVLQMLPCLEERAGPCLAEFSLAG